MADNVSVDFEGFDDLAAKLLSLGTKGSRVINQSLKVAGEIVSTAMQENVVVSTVEHQHIVDDIEVSKVKGSGDNKYVEIGPGKRTNWRAKFLELGTSKMSAQPFMARAIIEKRRAVTESMSKSLKQGLGL